MKNYLSNSKQNEYLKLDPNLKIHFKIINGVRYWLTPPPTGLSKMKPVRASVEKLRKLKEIRRDKLEKNLLDVQLKGYDHYMFINER